MSTGPTVGDRRTADERTRTVALVAAEFGLLALAFGTVATFTRLFIGWDFLATLAVPVLGSWGVAVVLRRLRVPVGASIAASLAIGVLVLAWRFAPATTWFGVPTPSTASAFAEQVRSAFGGFSDQIAPVPAQDGFLIGIAAVLWLFGSFADMSALRYSAPVQAVIPYAAAVAASGILARGAGRITAVLAFAAGLGVFAVTQRAWQSSGERWIRGDVGRGVRSIALGATVFAAFAVLVGIVIGPLVPGDDQALVDLRRLGRSEAPRTVVSPFVGVTSLLGERSDQVVFTVRAATPSYWRLTALEAYDAQRSIWTSRGTYRDAEGRLGDAPDPSSGAALEQDFRIDGLGGLWLPAAFEPAAVESRLDIGYDASSASLIVRNDSMTAGTTYRVQSTLQVLGVSELEQATSGDRTDVDPDTVAATGVSDEVRTTAERVAADAGATTPFAAARALQDWFRNEFTYDTSVDYRSEADPVSAFLRDRRGFCQQFASTFALMARSLGIPARVAVGFTPGDQIDDGAFVVRGRHAHAWPEVDLGSAGWVAFEPTPGRGNPQAAGYTGVEAAQAPPPPEQAASTTSTTTPTTTSPSAAAPDLPSEVDASATVTTEPPRPAATGGGVTSWWPLATVLLLLAGLVTAVPVVRRLLRRRRHRTDPMIGAIGVAWDDTVDVFRALGVASSATETPIEFADRVAGAIDDLELDDPGAVAFDVRTLAGLETRRRFGPGPMGEHDIELADELARQISAAASTGLGRRDRVLLRLR
ncbi:MAG: transglutaminaseTgpA domain-containing protein [Microthrixaceae bacterium]